MFRTVDSLRMSVFTWSIQLLAHPNRVDEPKPAVLTLRRVEAIASVPKARPVFRTGAFDGAEVYPARELGAELGQYFCQPCGVVGVHCVENLMMYNQVSSPTMAGQPGDPDGGFGVIDLTVAAEPLTASISCRSAHLNEVV